MELLIVNQSDYFLESTHANSQKRYETYKNYMVRGANIALISLINRKKLLGGDWKCIFCPSYTLVTNFMRMMGFFK